MLGAATVPEVAPGPGVEVAPRPVVEVMPGVRENSNGGTQAAGRDLYVSVKGTTQERNKTMSETH